MTPAYQSFFKEVKELVDSFASGPLASKVIDWTRMGRVIEFLKKQHIKLVRDMSEEMAREFARRSNSEVLPRAVFSLTNKGEMTIFLRPDATYYDIIHEIGHWVSFRATLAKTDGNWKAAFELWKKASPEMRERAVYRWMRAKFWDKLSDAEKRDANYQAFTRFGKKPPPD